MKNQFIPYELAVKLKELGFDEVCLAFYDGTKAFTYSPNNNKIYAVKILAPLWQQAFDWFREKGLHSWVYQSDKYRFHYTILKDGRYVKNDSDAIHYQEARQVCLEKLIELCQK